MNQVTLHISGMRCGMCEAHISDTIRKTCPDAKAVSASHSNNIAKFRIDREIDVKKLTDAVNETGYRCESVEVTPYEKKSLFHRR